MASIGMDRTMRVARVMADLSGDRLREARVLDLGCNDGGFSLEAARQGAAEVVGVEGRAENLAHAIERRAAEGLTQVEFINADVRSVTRERYGEFDVVLCLGLLYHLDVPDLFEFAAELAAMCRGYALVETQIGLKAKDTVQHGGRDYSGLWYAEDVSQPGASLDNRRSFWLTKPSLLNLLADVGFSSVAEVLNPVVPGLAEYRDHTLLVAAKGPATPPRMTERWAETLPPVAHPAQGLGYRVRDRLARVRGGGLPSLFR